MEETTLIVLLFLHMSLQAFNIFEAEILDGNRHDEYKVHGFADGTFSWSRCNASVVPIAVTSLSILPDPIQFGQTMTISVAFDVAEDIGTSDQTVMVDLNVTMKMGSKYLDVCKLKEDYCHFDLCNELEQQCPERLTWLCRCPFHKNVYSFDSLTFVLPIQKITVTGTFDITARLSSPNKELGCLNIQLCLGQC